ncbi:MAG: FHA domain-containing protein [Gammaproteobacteria bacterium]|nr:FHA domain-containing protein [Gammaproteobacteria bacterium]
MKRLFRARRLHLCMDERAHVFSCLADFDFAIAPRTAVPAARLAELMQRPAAELVAEDDTLRTLEHRLTGLVEDYTLHGISIAASLRQIGLVIFSKDHGWRRLFRSLLEASASNEDYLRVALERYVDYLSARRDTLRILIALRSTEEQPREARTTVFETPPLAADDSATVTSPLRRLPHGRAVMLRLEQGREVVIRLARHSFSLAHDQDWALLADDGQRYTLQRGVNTIGRSRDNSVMVSSALRNISRKHLLVETVGQDAVMLTDLSSSGTFIPPTAIAS